MLKSNKFLGALCTFYIWMNNELKNLNWIPSPVYCTVHHGILYSRSIDFIHNSLAFQVPLFFDTILSYWSFLLRLQNVMVQHSSNMLRLKHYTPPSLFTIDVFFLSVRLSVCLCVGLSLTADPSAELHSPQCAVFLFTLSSESSVDLSGAI